MVLNRQALLQLAEGRERVEGRDYIDVAFGGATVRICQLPADKGLDIAASGQTNTAAAHKSIVVQLIEACIVDDKFARIFNNVDEVNRWLATVTMSDVNHLLQTITDFVKIGDDEVDKAVANFTTTANGGSSSG